MALFPFIMYQQIQIRSFFPMMQGTLTTPDTRFRPLFGGLHVLWLLRPVSPTLHRLHDLPKLTFTELRGFRGAFATGVACQQGALTLPDTWFRPPFWDLLMLQLLRPNSSNLPCLYSTFHLEYPLVLSRFCLNKRCNTSWFYLLEKSFTVRIPKDLSISCSICLTIYNDNPAPIRLYTNPWPYEKKEDIWLKVPTPTKKKKTKKQRDNTQAPPKTSITQRLGIDFVRSDGVTIATQLVWLNRFTGSQASHKQQKLGMPLRARS